MVLELCHGVGANLWRLSSLNRKKFVLNDVALCQSLVQLTHAGCNPWKKLYSPDKLREDILVIGDRLIKNAEKESKKAKIRRSLTEFELVNFTELNQLFINGLQLLVEAVWRKESALDKLAAKVAKPETGEKEVVKKKKEIIKLFEKLKKRDKTMEFRRQSMVQVKMKRAFVELQGFEKGKFNELKISKNMTSL